MCRSFSSSSACCFEVSLSEAPGHPIQSPPDCSCGRRRPVARPPELRWTSTPESVALTVTGSRLATIRTRDMTVKLVRLNRGHT